MRRSLAFVSAVGCLAGVVVGGVVPFAVGQSAAETTRAVGLVVTLGDSYSSGLGIHRDAADYDDHGPPAHSFSAATRLGASACHRELDTTPGAKLAADLGARAVMAACAGAVIGDVQHQLELTGIPSHGERTLVLLTVGGNDVRTHGGKAWPDVLVRCITSHRCDRADSNQLSNLEAVHDDLVELYASIGADLPDAVVRVLAYPRLMQRERWGCPGVTGIGRPEADWIDDQVDRFNEVIADAVADARTATGADLGFVPVVDEFDNHGACRFWQRDRYVNDSLLGETLSRRRADDGTITDRYDDGVVTISGSSFHPGQKGYDAFYRAVSATLVAV